MVFRFTADYVSLKTIWLKCIFGVFSVFQPFSNTRWQTFGSAQSAIFIVKYFRIFGLWIRVYSLNVRFLKLFLRFSSCMRSMLSTSKLVFLIYISDDQILVKKTFCDFLHSFAFYQLHTIVVQCLMSCLPFVKAFICTLIRTTGLKCLRCFTTKGRKMNSITEFLRSCFLNPSYLKIFWYQAVK